MKKIIALLVIVGILGTGWFVINKNNIDTPLTKKPGTKTQAFDKKQRSIDKADSLWLVVDKHRPLQPADYIPQNLVAPDMPLRLTSDDEEMLMRADAADALAQLAADAKKEQVELMLSSGYRSYNFQKNLYNRYVREQGQATADSQSARPGFSEHQTGLTADVAPAKGGCVVEECFAETQEGKWVAANAYKYGFVIRYPKGKDSITGYIYEPWHLRYVGKTLAAEIHRQGNPTLEQFFGLPAAPDYEQQ